MTNFQVFWFIYIPAHVIALACIAYVMTADIMRRRKRVL